jgi:deaminated glutathione amidase
MAQMLRVAAVQLTSRQDVASNLERCQRLIATAAKQGARFVALPENFAFMGTEAAKRACAERLQGPPGPIRPTLIEAAQRHGIYLLAGGWPLVSDDPLRPYNAATLLAPTGELLATYRKMHLFDVDAPDGISYRESDGTSAGSEVVCAKVDGFCVGLSICYDIRFPELYRRLVEMGADVICIPAAFTAATGHAHWELLCRARAVESQCYVIAPGQSGTHLGGRQTFGHSLIVDPWGEILADAGDTETVVVADLVRDRLESVRRKLPCLRHRKL